MSVEKLGPGWVHVGGIEAIWWKEVYLNFYKWFPPLSDIANRSHEIRCTYEL